MAVRNDVKNRLVNRLAAGEISLAEATDRALAIDREWPPHRPEWYNAFPGSTLRERVAAALVHCTESATRDRPDRVAVAARMATELSALDGENTDGHVVH